MKASGSSPFAAEWRYIGRDCSPAATRTPLGSSPVPGGRKAVNQDVWAGLKRKASGRL